METREKIEALKSRNNELMKIMAKSDAHDCKCHKMNLSFQETYPEDYAEYVAANKEYNGNEAEIARLEAVAREEEAVPHDEDAPEAE